MDKFKEVCPTHTYTTLIPEHAARTSNNFKDMSYFLLLSSLHLLGPDIVLLATMLHNTTSHKPTNITLTFLSLYTTSLLENGIGPRRVGRQARKGRSRRDGGQTPDGRKRRPRRRNHLPPHQSPIRRGQDSRVRGSYRRRKVWSGCWRDCQGDRGGIVEEGRVVGG